MDIQGAVFSSAHRRSGGAWDGRKHLFYWKNSQAESASFPRGLLSRVEEYLKEESIKYRYRDKRKRVLPDADLTNVHADMLEGVSMSGDYSYQLEVVRTSLLAQQGILWLATNGGKSECAAAIIKTLSDLNVLFIVPKKTLLRQTVARLAVRLGTVEQEIGVIGSGRFDPKSVTVAIINSVTPRKVTKKTSDAVKRKRLAMKRYLKTVQCVFLDEGHRARSATWYKLIQSLTNGQFRYILVKKSAVNSRVLSREPAAVMLHAFLHEAELPKHLSKGKVNFLSPSPYIAYDY